MSSRGYSIEQLKPGMGASLIKTITEADVEDFGALTGDHNPLHFDEAFARDTIFKGRIIHGMFTASLLSAVLGVQMPGPGWIFMGLNIRFRAPVRIGDTVTAGCTVREIIAAKHRVALDCACTVNDAIVLDGDALMMAPVPTG